MNLPSPIRSRSTALALLFLLGLGACQPPDSMASASVAVDPEFETFWRAGGALATFGPPISASRRQGGSLRQAFLAVEMIADEDGVRLAPLGLELGLAEPPVAPIPGQQEAYFEATGHSLYAGFAVLHERLGGAAVIGAPISEAAFREGQIVQYFENAGMYRAESSSPSDARLMALGLTARPPADSFGLDPESLVLRGRVRQRPFGAYLQAFGGEAIVGQPLTEPYTAADGALEQVYERVVVFSPDGSSRGAGLRPLGAGMGPPDEPATRAVEPGSLFFKDTGHNVRWAFADFYRQRDGRQLLGLPLEEALLRDDALSQRFEKGMLVYHFDLPLHLAVQLAPLGRAHLEANPAPTAVLPPVGPTSAATPASGGAAEDLVVEAILAYPIVPPDEEQELQVRVLRADGEALENAVVSVRLDGASATRQVRLPSTDDEGRTGWRWTDDPATPGEIVTVVVDVRLDGASGTFRLAYAHGFPSGR